LLLAATVRRGADGNEGNHQGTLNCLFGQVPVARGCCRRAVGCVACCFDTEIKKESKPDGGKAEKN